MLFLRAGPLPPPGPESCGQDLRPDRFMDCAVSPHCSYAHGPSSEMSRAPSSLASAASGQGGSSLSRKRSTAPPAGTYIFGLGSVLDARRPGSTRWLRCCSRYRGSARSPLGKENPGRARARPGVSKLVWSKGREGRITARRPPVRRRRSPRRPRRRRTGRGLRPSQEEESQVADRVAEVDPPAAVAIEGLHAAIRYPHPADFIRVADGWSASEPQQRAAATSCSNGYARSATACSSRRSSWTLPGSRP